MLNPTRSLEVRKRLRAVLPQQLIRGLRYIRRLPALVFAGVYDLGIYVRSSSVVNYEDEEEKLRALITATYHSLEKGLALSSPRLGFGKAHLARLIAFVEEAHKRFGPRSYLDAPLGALSAYILHHEARGHDVAEIRQKWAQLVQKNAEGRVPTLCGGVVAIDYADVAENLVGTTSAFFRARHSCRQFSSEPLDAKDIEEAVEIAQTAPAVCNRQSGRIYAFLDRDDIQKILDLQGGAKGFASEVPALFCVTVDVRNFFGVGERYQAWIDGGLFAMNFLLGLHMQGLGSCCLNWSKSPEEDREMRSLIKLPNHEIIVMFVAAGRPPRQLAVACSVRRGIEEVLQYRSLES